MKDYKVENPQFTDTLQITETTDTSHADNINRAPKQAFENTLYLEKTKVAADGGDVSDTIIKTEGEAGDEDYPVPAAGDTPKTFLAKTKKFISNFKDWMTGVCMLGAIVNNCVTDNPNLPLSAAQGKALQDALTVLNNELKVISNNINDKIYYLRPHETKTWTLRAPSFLMIGASNTTAALLYVLSDSFKVLSELSTTDLSTLISVSNYRVTITNPLNWGINVIMLYA